MAVTPEEFTIRAIKNLRNKGYKGIHSVYSGFNQAFRTQFPTLDVVQETKKLNEQGKIHIELRKGGAMLYLPDELPESKDRSKEVIAKILA